jgi:hypothetical protein
MVACALAYGCAPEAEHDQDTTAAVGPTGTAGRTPGASGDGSVAGPAEPGGGGTGGANPPAGSAGRATANGGNPPVEPGSCQSKGVASVDGYAMWPLPSFRVGKYATDETSVVDQVTLLEWQRLAPDQPFELEAARTYCDELDLNGCSDWRLPSRIELLTIVDFSKYDPAVDTAVFPNTPSELFWSSSAKLGSPGAVWGVNFQNGSANNAGAEGPYRVRCVR